MIGPRFPRQLSRSEWKGDCLACVNLQAMPTSKPPMRPLLPACLAVLSVLCASSPCKAEDAVSPTISLGMFFEFGDEKGTSGGFDVWVGATYYPDLNREASDTVAFASAGVQLRTGLIPVMTGPNQFSPQLRAGLAFVDAPHADEDGLGSTKRPLPKAKVYAIAGYRWAAAFGLDNMDHLRKDEQAFRVGLGAVIPAWPAALDFPIPDGGEFLVDINHDGGVDRVGFDVVVGF